MPGEISWELLLPLIATQLLFQVISLFSLIRSSGVRRWNKTAWALIILLMGILGPVLYWTLGREAE